MASELPLARVMVSSCLQASAAWLGVAWTSGQQDSQETVDIDFHVVALAAEGAVQLTYQTFKVSATC